MGLEITTTTIRITLEYDLEEEYHDTLNALIRLVESQDRHNIDPEAVAATMRLLSKMLPAHGQLRPTG